MTERTNRRAAIIEAAARLFIELGYVATSVRQIAEAVGVTEAALYYHFKEGKRALLQAVLAHKTPEMLTAIAELEGATSLDDLMTRFTHSFLCLADMEQRMDQLRWMIAEYDRFTPAERDMINIKQQELQGHLAHHLARFVPTPRDAERLAWLLLCAVIGYEQFFVGMGHPARSDFTPEQMLYMLRAMVTGQSWFAQDITEGTV